MATIKLENKSARILMVGIGGGECVTIPPTEGGIEVSFDDAEQERFDKAVATPAVKEWIDAGELVVSVGEAEPEAKAPAEDMAKSARNPVPPLPEKKAKHGFFSGDKDKGEP